MSLTLAAIYAGATFAGGALSEHAKRKGKYGNADERNRAARESLLTAKYNINQRKIEGRQTQFQVLETGGRKTQEIAVAGLQAEGAAEVAGGSSGATIDSGSPRAVLTSIVQEALQAQTNVIVDTRNHIRAVARDTTNKNTSEWRNAKLNEKQQNRMADQERESADREYLAGMINTSIKTAGAFASAYTPSPASGAVSTTTAVAPNLLKGRQSIPPKTRIPKTGRPNKSSDFSKPTQGRPYSYTSKVWPSGNVSYPPTARGSYGNKMFGNSRWLMNYTKRGIK